MNRDRRYEPRYFRDKKTCFADISQTQKKKKKPKQGKCNIIQAAATGKIEGKECLSVSN